MKTPSRLHKKHFRRRAFVCRYVLYGLDRARGLSGQWATLVDTRKGTYQAIRLKYPIACGEVEATSDTLVNLMISYGAESQLLEKP